jgi:small-conductance mechanosensitive channel
MDLILEYFRNIEWKDIISSGMRIMLILVMVWILSGIIRSMLKRLQHTLVTKGHEEGDVPSEAAKRAETLVKLLRQGVVIVMWVMAILLILRQLGMDITPVLASAGVVGLAVGFGAQNLVRDVISGFFMILENQVRVGDVAVINGTGGLVERINFRTIVLRDLSGVVHTFPNGTINTLANMTREWSAFVFDIGVAYKEDTDKVVEALQHVGAALRQDPHFGPLMLADVEIFGVDKFADSAVVVKGRIKTLPVKQWEVGREFQRRVKKAFDQAGIEIPFPHLSVYFGEASKPFTAQLVKSAQEHNNG